MNFHIFANILTVTIIISLATNTINASGQTDLTSQAMQTNKTIQTNTTGEQQLEQQNKVLDKEIKITSSEFNQLLDEIKGSINLIQEKKYDAATSKLGLAIIEILNSTQQYQELVQFASSQYVNNIEQQFNNEENN